MFRHRNEFPIEGLLGSFEGATEWINSGPLTPEALRGRVVLVSFGTYTCINWIRSLPWVRAWADKYAQHGLMVVGVQTPEFDFEGDLDNVHRAIKEMDVRYPVAVDNDYAVWEAFDNHYWPALYFVDVQGRIRHHRFGEGEYEESERVLQMLLGEAGVEDVDRSLVSLEPAGVELPGDWNNLRSSENYLGYGRTFGFASPSGPVPDAAYEYTTPDSLRLNQWALSGRWQIGAVTVGLHDPAGTISCRFHARDVHLVMGPPSGHGPVPYRVRVDRGPPGAAHGIDCDADGNGVATYQRMYQLVRQPGPIADRLFEIDFPDAGVEAFVFTFG